MSIYVEFKNGVILPTEFPNTETGLKALNDVGSFISIKGNVYNKFSILRIYETKKASPFLESIARNSYEIQEVLRAIVRERSKQGRKINSYKHLMVVYKKMLEDRDTIEYGIQPYSLDMIQEDGLYLPPNQS